MKEWSQEHEAGWLAGWPHFAHTQEAGMNRTEAGQQTTDAFFTQGLISFDEVLPPKGFHDTSIIPQAGDQLLKT